MKGWIEKFVDIYQTNFISSLDTITQSGILHLFAIVSNVSLLYLYQRSLYGKYWCVGCERNWFCSPMIFYSLQTSICRNCNWSVSTSFVCLAAHLKLKWNAVACLCTTYQGGFSWVASHNVSIQMSDTNYSERTVFMS